MANKYRYEEIDLKKPINQLMQETRQAPIIRRDKNGRWLKGQCGRTTPVKKKREIARSNAVQIRNFLMLVMQRNLPRLQEDLSSMNAFNRWQILDRLSRSFLPSLTATKIDQTVDGEIKINVKFESSGDGVQNINDIEGTEEVD